MPPESTQARAPDADHVTRTVGWSLAALKHPAYVRVAAAGADDHAAPRWIAAQDRFWLDWLTQTIEQVLRQELGVRPTIAPMRLGGGEHAPPVFAACLSITPAQGGIASRCVIAIRQDAARAIVDAVLAEASGLMGRGSLTPAELGILEFVGLLLAEAVSQKIERGFGAVAPTFAIERFASGPEAAAETALQPSVSLAIEVSGRHGEVIVVYDGWIGDGSAMALAAAVGSSFVARDRDPVEVPAGVALGPVAISAEELARAAPGDAVLLGCSELDARAPHACVATRTGWSLCRAEIVHNLPTVLTACCHALTPEPLAGWMSSAAKPLVVPVLGDARLTAATLKSWTPGRIQDFARPSGEVELWMNGSLWATGELARVGDEIAVRLLRVAMPASGGGAGA
ncbi:MAG: hypothetical protein AMXMBFR58_30210 [Phycisphaerae bacterium]